MTKSTKCISKDDVDKKLKRLEIENSLFRDGFFQLERTTSKLRNSREKLKKSYKRLKELDKRKSEFINVVSHQLRTPLSSIRWNTEMLLNDELGKIASKNQKNGVNRTNGRAKNTSLWHNIAE